MTVFCECKHCVLGTNIVQIKSSMKTSVDLSMVIDGYTAEEDREYEQLLENCGECIDCGDADTGYCFCTTLDFEVEYANDEERKILDDYLEENDKFRGEREQRNKVRNARCLLIKLKKHVVCRNVGFYWFGQSVARACAEGGKYRKDDKTHFIKECPHKVGAHHIGAHEPSPMITVIKSNTPKPRAHRRATHAVTFHM